MTTVTDWLLEGPAWIAYRTRVELLGQTETAEPVLTSPESDGCGSGCEEIG